VPGSSSDDGEAEEQPRWSRSVTSISLVAGALAAVGLVLVAASPSALRGASPTRTSSIFSASGLVSVNVHASDDKPDYSKCSWGKQNCNETKCCNNPGKQCYQQTEWYAQCRDDCTKGPDPTHWDGKHWTCKELGPRAEGDGTCSGFGEDCRETQCCSQPGTQCFRKNEGWAVCKSSCIPGAPDLHDINSDPWSCEPLGEWTQGAQAWVQDECTPEGEDCSKTKCCTGIGEQCFKKTDFWAQCKPYCTTVDAQHPWDGEWDCTPLGPVTPHNAGPQGGPISDWVVDACAGEGEDCSTSRCCLVTDQQCYKKNKDWSMCMESCTPGYHLEDNNESWSCEEMGPRNVAGLGVKGTPSLYCWSLFQTTTEENDLIKYQIENDAGILQCDETALLSTAKETDMGKSKSGKAMKTMHVDMAEITVSQDGTSGNAKLFINCWNVIIDDGRWRHYAWIVKVDPDAVIIPDRVRSHLTSHVDENVYVVNCNKFPSSPNFPMMYGSVEIYSYKAIKTYKEKQGRCQEDMGMMLPKWGEDYYMTHCLDHIGVGRISDYASVGDNVCSGGACSDPYFSAFHPHKTTEDWTECWEEAHGKEPPPQPSWR